jgi:hypothetical protein
MPQSFTFPEDTDRGTKAAAVVATKKLLLWYWGRHPSLKWMIYIVSDEGDGALELKQRRCLKRFVQAK